MYKIDINNKNIFFISLLSWLFINNIRKILLILLFMLIIDAELVIKKTIINVEIIFKQEKRVFAYSIV